MNDSLFSRALKKSNRGRPPVWFMRQAGRYHSHYQALRKKYSFLDLCKKPEIACEAALGPVRDFGFDAAILFSDLLFPLEVMGMGLRYDPGPKLEGRLAALGDAKRLKQGAALAAGMDFQAEAILKLRKALEPSIGLLGFVGGPATLYTYAVEGTHAGELASAKEGFTDGRYQLFTEKLHELLVANMVSQAKAGADAIAILDTAAGEFDLGLYRGTLVPAIKAIAEDFKKACPGVSLVYYSKSTDPGYWETLRGLPLDGLGVDWKVPMPQVLSAFGDQWAIQGNWDPHALLLPPSELEPLLIQWFTGIKALGPQKTRGWICGLGHGILPGVPEGNVRLFLKLQKQVFAP